MELIDNKTLSSLVNMFREFDCENELDQLFESANFSFSDLIDNKIDFEDTSDRQELLFDTHKLMNKFKNLGMTASVNHLKKLEHIIKDKQKSSDSYSEALENLKKVTFQSFNKIFEQYLG